MSDTAWDDIVGIDLDDWMHADSGEQIQWMAWLRDHPMPRQGPPPRRECDNCVSVMNFGSTFTARICGGIDCEWTEGDPT